MSKSMAAEFGPDKVRVNCVNPVFSPDTALSAEFAGGAVTEEARKAFLATIPLGRFSTPLDVANACLYLASDEAAMVSGNPIASNRTGNARFARSTERLMRAVSVNSRNTRVTSRGCARSRFSSNTQYWPLALSNVTALSMAGIPSMAADSTHVSSA